MTKLRGYIPTMLMLATLMFGATAANAGILITSRTESASSNQESSLIALASSVATFLQTGILVTDRTGILVTDRTGILITS
jgi:hypothetical protein